MKNIFGKLSIGFIEMKQSLNLKKKISFIDLDTLHSLWNIVYLKTKVIEVICL